MSVPMSQLVGVAMVRVGKLVDVCMQSVQIAANHPQRVLRGVAETPRVRRV